MALEAGQKLGPYEIIEPIGKGGMGEVYRARDTKLDRDVAIKVLPDEFAQDEERLARFEREAKLLASLNHPNIASIYGFESGALVLELVEGPTLAERIAEGPIPVEEAIAIAKQITEALEAGHEAGVIHRDLKPANVKVKEDGTVKVLDYGLAKALEGEAVSSPDSELSQSPTLTRQGTQIGVILGTAAYMSPEQARGKVVNKRADIWSFGCVLFEMLTGTRAFEGEDVTETLAAVVKSEPEWTALPTALDPSIRTFLVRCLEKNPKQRVHDVADIRLALDGAFETTGLSVSGPAVAPTLPAWQRPMAIAATALAALVIGGVAVWTRTQPAPRPGLVSRFRIPLAVDQAFSRNGRTVVSISPDGSQVIYSANGTLWLRPVDRLEAVEVPLMEAGAVGPFFSTDGQSIGYWAAGRLKKISVTGGVPVTIAELADMPDGASWGADDAILYGYDGGVMRVSGAAGTPEVLIPLDDPEAAHAPQMLPGGEWVLYTLRPGGPGTWNDAQIVVQSVTGGERTVLLEGRDGRYVSTGHLIFVLDHVLFAVPFDVGSREVTGSPVPLVDGIAEVGSTSGAAHFGVSANGTLAYVPEASRLAVESSLVWVTPTGDETETAAPVRAYNNVRVSPDGSRVAASVSYDGNVDVWIWRLDQGPLTRLTFHEAWEVVPVWTPDSSRVVFASNRKGLGLFWKAADGTGEVEQLLERVGFVFPGEWSADGRLVFETARNVGVFTVESARAEMLFDSEFDRGSPALSPNGRWIAYASDESGRPEIYVQPFPDIDDGKWQVSIDGGRHPVWTPDGRRLFYAANVGMMVAEVETTATFDASAPTRAFGLANYRTGGMMGRRSYDIAPDGERFLVPKPVATETAGREPFNGMIVVEHWFQELSERVPVP